MFCSLNHIELQRRRSVRIVRCFSERRQKIFHRKFEVNVRVGIAALNEMSHTVMLFDDQSLNVMPNSL